MSAPVATPAPASTPVTFVDRSPPGEPYVNGMQLGASVDAITGEILGSAIDPKALVTPKQIIPSDAGETYEVKTFSDARELAQTTTVGASSSVSAPVDGITVGGSRSLDFSDTENSSDSSMYYMMNWQRVGPIQAIPDGFNLSEPALDYLAKKDPDTFRNTFGDYFVSQIAYGAKFTAVWKCTASSSESLQAFKSSMTANVEAEGAASGSASLETAMNKSAKSNNVTLNCRYDIVGSAVGIEYDTNSVNSTFQSFIKVVNLAPTTIYLKHYNTVDSRIPYTIPMDPSVYEDLIQFYGIARYVLFLSGVAPGSTSSRTDRGDQVRTIFKTIISQRQKYIDNPASLEESLRTLKGLRTKFENLLDRQDLIQQARNLTYDDLRKLFNVDKENADGAWIKSAKGRTFYEFGRNSFSNEERQRYAVVPNVEVSHRKFGEKLAHSQASQLSYPGEENPSANGIVVGITVEDKWGDGTNGRWCLPKNNPLGTNAFQIPIHTAVSRGLNWALHVSYIPASEYDE